MASGHVSRTQRPNTWLHRPSLRREESSCQPGAVHTWPILPRAFAAACPQLAEPDVRPPKEGVRVWTQLRTFGQPNLLWTHNALFPIKLW